jgi:exopolysaccharide production protein ExoZ
MARVRSIQILRGVAAGLVVLSHTIPGALGQAGAIGVDVFFVISGFIIYRVSKGREPLAFLRDRATRIMPLWWLMAVPWVGLATKLHLMTLPMLAATVTLWPVWGAATLPALKPGWSLEFELLFYLATALGLALPRMRAWLPALWALSLFGAILTHWPLLQYVGNPMVLEFAAGAMIARSSYRSRCLGALAVVLAVSAFGWFAWNGTDQLEDPLGLLQMAVRWRWLLWGVPAAALVWGARQFEEVFKGRAAAPFVYLGDASYSIYLTNFLTVLFFLHLLPGWLLWAACIGVGILVYRYVEVPLLGFLHRRPPPLPIPQAA